MLGNHLPRRCGIATFTTDLCDALAAACPDLDPFVLAMNDAGERHRYPGRVRFEIEQNDISSYRRAADFLNVNRVDVLSVQHEFGIFGGKAGAYVLPLLRDLRMPIVTTLHTILAEPNAPQRDVMGEIVELSQRLVVMSEHGAELVRRVYGAPEQKIDFVPHGIAAAPLAHGSKHRLGVERKFVILTFGLLSPDKGIEYVIDALPAIVERHPDTLYVVLGATHPHVKERHGETYRILLEERAHRLGVDESVIFYDRFVEQSELAEFMSAADVYVTPYLNPEQITSGTLAYAVGSGKAVVSTPYRYARELLSEGRGVLVPWRDGPAIARAILDLMDDEAKRSALCDRARELGRAMLWPAVAQGYRAVFDRAASEHAEQRSAFQAKTLAKRPAQVLATNLDHVRLMSDGTGMLQHARFNVPRYADGYCLDDNARALLLMALLEGEGTDEAKLVRELAARYMAFVAHAFDESAGRFRNFLTYGRRWGEERGSEDSHGRALWALGAVVGRSADAGKRSLGGSLFHAALPVANGFTSPRAWAFSLLGIDEYLGAFEGDTSVQETRRVLGERLLGSFRAAHRRDWAWFEDCVSYDNARLPQALLVSGARMRHEEMTSVGLGSLDWLDTVQRSDTGAFAPVGSNGFFRRGQPMARFDQQPLEACAMVSACVEARRLTGDARWTESARRAFAWFLGENHLQQSLYDPSTGGCRDGLHEDRVNENQGAESTLAFQLALLELRSIDRIPSVRLVVGGHGA